LCEENSCSTEGRSFGANHGPKKIVLELEKKMFLISHDIPILLVCHHTPSQPMYLFPLANDNVNCAHHVITQCFLAGSVNPPESSLKNMFISLDHHPICMLKNKNY